MINNFLKIFRKILDINYVLCIIVLGDVFGLPSPFVNSSFLWTLNKGVNLWQTIKISLSILALSSVAMLVSIKKVIASKFLFSVALRPISSTASSPRVRLST